MQPLPDEVEESTPEITRVPKAEDVATAEQMEVIRRWRGSTLEDWRAAFDAIRNADEARSLVLARHAMKGELLPRSYVDGDMTYVADTAGWNRAVRGLAEAEGPIGLDLETTALDPKDGLIRLVQLSRGGPGVVTKRSYYEISSVAHIYPALRQVDSRRRVRWLQTDRQKLRRRRSM